MTWAGPDAAAEDRRVRLSLGPLRPACRTATSSSRTATRSAAPRISTSAPTSPRGWAGRTRPSARAAAPLLFMLAAGRGAHAVGRNDNAARDERLHRAEWRTALFTTACWMPRSATTCNSRSNWLFFTTAARRERLAPGPRKPSPAGRRQRSARAIRCATRTAPAGRSFSVEERYFTDWYPFRLFRVGRPCLPTPDADVGKRAARRSPVSGVLEDAGFGLRFGNARSGFGNVVHVDVAFPLNVRPGIDKAQFLIQTRGELLTSRSDPCVSASCGRLLSRHRRLEAGQSGPLWVATGGVRRAGCFNTGLVPGGAGVGCWLGPAAAAAASPPTG